MIDFSSEYFQKFSFSQRQLEAYLNSAKHQLKIASDSQVPEVIFEFSYNALIKFGIFLLSQSCYIFKPSHSNY